MHSLHFVLVVTHSKPDEPLAFPFTDGAKAREAYEGFRDDPDTRHARLYHNPVPNGGVYDGPPPPPEPEPEPVKEPKE